MIILGSQSLNVSNHLQKGEINIHYFRPCLLKYFILCVLQLENFQSIYVSTAVRAYYDISNVVLNVIP
jgi:hypothetical protein